MHANTGMVKNVNEGIIVKKLLDGEVVTKQSLAQVTGLSFPTVGKIIDGLAEEKLVLALGTESSSQGGRKAELYRFNENSAFALCIYVQEQEVRCVTTDAIGKVVMKQEFIVGDEGYICKIKQIIRKTIETNPSVKAIAVGIPGGVSNGVVCYIDGYDELKNCDLRHLIEAEFRIGTRVENNMRAVTCGLSIQKYPKDRETVVCLHIANNGPGCGVLVNGKPISGFKGFIGEVGYLPLYNHKNLQQIALDNFKEADAVDYFARLISSICIFYNPEEIILYENSNYIRNIENIREKCRQYIPEIAVPKVLLSKFYQQDYENGLIELAKNILYPAYIFIRE